MPVQPLPLSGFENDTKDIRSPEAALVLSCMYGRTPRRSVSGALRAGDAIKPGRRASPHAKRYKASRATTTQPAPPMPLRHVRSFTARTTVPHHAERA